jgi:hypothetical protein
MDRLIHKALTYRIFWLNDSLMQLRSLGMTAPGFGSLLALGI